MDIKLSKYLDEQVASEEQAFSDKCDKVISYLKENIKDVDLDKQAGTSNNVEIYRRLCGWLFNFFHDELYNSFKLINYDKSDFEKQSLYSFMMSISRDRDNVDILYNMYKIHGVINEVRKFEDNMYEIDTNDYGVLSFYKAKDIFKDNEEVLEYIESLGERIKDGCHEVTYYLLEKFKTFKAVTSIVKKELGCTQYHSFLLDTEYNFVIDVARNIAMPKDLYYMLNDVEEINVLTYDECQKLNELTKKYDESNTLFDLLRNAAYKKYMNEPEKIK